jgi:hypothetical protein
MNRRIRFSGRPNLWRKWWPSVKTRWPKSHDFHPPFMGTCTNRWC